MFIITSNLFCTNSCFLFFYQCNFNLKPKFYIQSIPNQDIWKSVGVIIHYSLILHNKTTCLAPLPLLVQSTCHRWFNYFLLMHSFQRCQITNYACVLYIFLCTELKILNYSKYKWMNHRTRTILKIIQILN